MAQADPTPTTNLRRRDFLLSAAASSAALSQARLEATDAIILALGRQFDVARQEESATWHSWDGVESATAEAACCAANDRTAALVTKIIAEPARTLAGLRVKARAYAWCWGGDPNPEVDTTDTRVLASMLSDILATEAA